MLDCKECVHCRKVVSIGSPLWILYLCSLEPYEVDSGLDVVCWQDVEDFDSSGCHYFKKREEPLI